MKIPLRTLIGTEPGGAVEATIATIRKKQISDII